MDKFKSKYHKYKTKYLNLIDELKIAKMKGGIRDNEFDTFKNELISIYQLVSGVENSICIGGSSEIAYLLYKLKLKKELKEMIMPGDVDLMYSGRENGSKIIGDFLPKKGQETPQSSRTWIYTNNNNENKYKILKSFDLTGNGKSGKNTLKYFTLKVL